MLCVEIVLPISVCALKCAQARNFAFNAKPHGMGELLT
jgi:hypothetical protein